MSGFLSSKYLKYRSELYRHPIDTDLRCVSCGYNLRGLNYGRNCPECSTPIEPVAGDVLLAGGETRRRGWRIGFAIAFACLVGAVAARLVVFLLGAAGLSRSVAWAYLYFGLVLSFMWAVAAWMLTPAILGKRFMFMGTLRWVVRLTQLLWPVGYACWMIGFSDSSRTWLMWSRALRLGAGMGAILLAVMLIPVAQSAQCENAQRRLNAAAWLLPGLTLLPQAFPATMQWIWLIPLGMLLLLWAWMMMAYAMAVGELQRHVRWAMIDAERLASREARVARTRAAHDRALEASVRPPPPPEPEIPLE